jgi:hypothetical protein
MNMFRIEAGEMKVENGKVKPNTNKGEIKISINPDNILIFEWTDLQTNTTTDPLAIFGNEWQWNKIPTQKGRVYCLESEVYGEKYFYWLQYTDSSQDSINESIISNILKTGKLTTHVEESNKTEITGMNNFEKVENKQTNQDFIKSLTQTIKTEKNKLTSLGKILNKTNILKVVSNDNIDELLKY